MESRKIYVFVSGLKTSADHQNNYLYENATEKLIIKLCR